MDPPDADGATAKKKPACPGVEQAGVVYCSANVPRVKPRNRVVGLSGERK